MDGLNMESGARGVMELIDVTYFPVEKNQGLGPKRTRHLKAKRGENPFLAAERALRKSFKVKDFLILDANLAESGFREATAADG